MVVPWPPVRSMVVPWPPVTSIARALAARYIDARAGRRHVDGRALAARHVDGRALPAELGTPPVTSHVTEPPFGAIPPELVAPVAPFPFPPAPSAPDPPRLPLPSPWRPWRSQTAPSFRRPSSDPRALRGRGAAGFGSVEPEPVPAAPVFAMAPVLLAATPSVAPVPSEGAESAPRATTTERHDQRQKPDRTKQRSRFGHRNTVELFTTERFLQTTSKQGTSVAPVQKAHKKPTPFPANATT